MSISTGHRQVIFPDLVQMPQALWLTLQGRHIIHMDGIRLMRRGSSLERGQSGHVRTAPARRRRAQEAGLPEALTLYSQEGPKYRKDVKRSACGRNGSGRLPLFSGSAEGRCGAGWRVHSQKHRGPFKIKSKSDLVPNFDAFVSPCPQVLELMPKGNNRIPVPSSF